MFFFPFLYRFPCGSLVKHLNGKANRWQSTILRWRDYWTRSRGGLCPLRIVPILQTWHVVIREDLRRILGFYCFGGFSWLILWTPRFLLPPLIKNRGNFRWRFKNRFWKAQFYRLFFLPSSFRLFSLFCGFFAQFSKKIYGLTESINFYRYSAFWGGKSAVF